MYGIAHLTLGMLLQYLGKLKIQISADIWPIWKKMEAYCTLTRPQVVIFWVLKNGMSFPILIAHKIFYVTVLLVINFVINLWHQKFVTGDVTAMFVNNQHGI